MISCPCTLTSSEVSVIAFVCILVLCRIRNYKACCRGLVDEISEDGEFQSRTSNHMLMLPHSLELVQ